MHSSTCSKAWSAVFVNAVAVFVAGGVAIGCAPVGNEAPRTAAEPDASHIVVTTAAAPTRNCDVIAVFDLHTAADSEDKGFNELRRRAAQIGADAVIGAEFEHGEGAEPSHLSGMAVRYSPTPPPYDVIQKIDITSPGDSSDKGLEQLARQAHDLGADLVVGVAFEHGEGSEPSHLTGTAVRFRR